MNYVLAALVKNINIVMVDNFLHMFTTYKKSLKEQRNDIDQLLSRTKSRDQIQPVKKLKKKDFRLRIHLY